MNIVVTGSKGFIGKNLCMMLRESGFNDIHEIDRNTSHNQLLESLNNADFIYHLAGINRPKDEIEFKQGNTELTQLITDFLSQENKKTPLVISSSTQAHNDNAYGKSKLLAEKAVEIYGENSGAPVYIYRLPNVFGKWCRPNYNSFIATFCYNVLNDIELTVNDYNAPVTLVYIDDVCRNLISLLKNTTSSGFQSIKPEYQTSVGIVADTIMAFKESRNNLITEDVGLGFNRALYSTYLSYMNPAQFSYTIPSYGDERGIFSEMLKTKTSGQFSFFTAHPGITRGGHYHHSKNEKFLVLKGTALYRFKNMLTHEKYELKVNSDSFLVVETVPGWSHDITNIGEDEMIVMLWANEIFDRTMPDTFAYPLK
ncbi:NAD-dependent epimerase/dehydratase family protein [Pectobacterium polonicum]|uniref:UDP-2-acetamido-2,6-beta-L-arabino-hexul-4-ose reductase n=1 Tax=Pectobacterium polonicum TaxID=2485124 RepID=UPI0010F520AA|nr:NAD-dependent epimerase/dehydratase family protein [Pectobacterium polonicum]TKY80185.1 SDR family oxidoreductase [Pectobacterium polonicum]